jgi:predicted phage baseplate assembly protein
MTSAVDANIDLNDCGCCEGISTETPLTVFNRAGLSAIAYRVGTHNQFKESLIARLSGLKDPTLRGLTTRDDDDFTIALLDAWATVGDVLTFYQERIANEGYLRTATERRSVLELAQLINYQLRPGVAASTYLAFTLEDAPGALGQSLGAGTTAQIAPEKLPPITIGSGTKVQSIPGPDEKPQTFETVEEIEARVTWNAIKPRLKQPQTISTEMQTIFFSGTATNLKPGDRLLILDGVHQPAIKSILKMTADDDADTTRIDFASSPPPLPKFTRPSDLLVGKVSDFATSAVLNNNQSVQILSQSWSAKDLFVVAQIQGWSLNDLTTSIGRQWLSGPTLSPDVGVFAFRQQVGIFGHNAPHYNSLLNADSGHLYPIAWDPSFEIWRDSMADDFGNPPNPPNYYVDADIYLERNVPGITKESWVVLELTRSNEVTRALFNVADVKEASITGFGISGKSTALKLAKPDKDRTPLVSSATDKPAEFKVRKTNVLAQSDRLTLAELPIPDALDPASVVADGITLDGPYIDLKPGQRIIISGEQDDLRGVFVSESLVLKDVVLEAGFTVISFTQAPVYSYVRDTVIINANIALATHGESVSETLGGGDASQSFQRFVLLQPPVTYVTDSNPSGALTTLEIRVNDILWHEVPDFFGHGPTERIYITRLDDDGKTTVVFGNGETGTRLPTGQENIKATYRKGIGEDGLVKAHQLTQLMTRPLGVKGVTNPTAASGAADAEKLSDARRNAPLTILTLGRVVSLQDYQDFARAFSGIEKALATPVEVGERNGVFVTIAGAKGASVLSDSTLFSSLLTAIEQAGDSTVPLILKSYQPRFFRLSGQVKIDPDFLPENVLAQIEQKLRDSFSFRARDFGQPVHQSEVVALIQSVSGVVSANLITFHRSDENPTKHLHLVAAIPAPGGQDLTPAEILMLDPQPITFEVLK